MKQTKIARIEELIAELRDGDVGRLLRGWPSYDTWCKKADTYYADQTYENWAAFLKATADLIEEAMEGDF